jgi:hypothetical protein
MTGDGSLGLAPRKCRSHRPRLAPSVGAASLIPHETPGFYQRVPIGFLIISRTLYDSQAKEGVMAQRVEVILEDDIDGSPADETVRGCCVSPRDASTVTAVEPRTYQHRLGAGLHAISTRSSHDLHLISARSLQGLLAHSWPERHCGAPRSGKVPTWEIPLGNLRCSNIAMLFRLFY